MGSYMLLMIEILHYLKDPKLWELWYIPYCGSCRISIINRMSHKKELPWSSWVEGGTRGDGASKAEPSTTGSRNPKTP